MKGNSETNKALKARSVAMFLIVSMFFAGSTNVAGWHKTPSPDEVDEVMKAASSALPALDAVESTLNAGATIALLADISKSYSELEKSLEAEFAKLMRETRENTNDLENKINEIDRQIELLKTQLAKLKALQQTIDDLLPKFMDAFATDQNAKKTRSCMQKIASDRELAVRILSAIKANLNNASGLSRFLNNELPGSNVVVSEVSDRNGLLVRFRIGTLDHCISTKANCLSKSYSVARNTTIKPAPNPITDHMRNLTLKMSNVSQLINSIKNVRERKDETQKAIVAADEQTDQAISSLVSALKAINEIRIITSIR